MIPYFKGFLIELKEILCNGAGCSGGMLGDLGDFLRANAVTTTPPSTIAANNNNITTTTTTGHSVNNNNPGPVTNSFMALGSFNAAATLNSSTVNNISHGQQNVGFSCSTNLSNSNNISGSSNKNLLGDPNGSKLNNSNTCSISNIGPTSNSHRGSQSNTEPDLGNDSITRGMQTVNLMGSRSPQDQRRELGGHPSKSSQQKVVSFMVGRGPVCW